MISTFRIFKVIVVFLFTNFLFAQEGLEPTESKNAFIFNFGYTHIPVGSELESESKNGFFVPTIGFDYGREISEKWELLVMLDFELGKYLIVNKDLNREHAFIVLGGASYKLFKSVKLVGGLGVEFEKNENLFITRLGGEYIHELNKPWALMAGAYWDHKKEYSTYSLVAGIVYAF